MVEKRRDAERLRMADDFFDDLTDKLRRTLGKYGLESADSALGLREEYFTRRMHERGGNLDKRRPYRECISS